MYRKALPLIAALLLSSGVALAQTGSGSGSGAGTGSNSSGNNTGQNDNTGGTSTGSTGSIGTSTHGLDVNNDGRLTLQEFRQSGQSGDDMFSGLSSDQIRSLQDDCKNDQVADNKDTCDRLAKMK